MFPQFCSRNWKRSLWGQKKASPLTLRRGSGRACEESRQRGALARFLATNVPREIDQISPKRLICKCKSCLFVLPLRLPLRAFGPSFRRGTAGGMLARARCDETKHSRAVARLSIAVGRRLQARAALPEAGRPRRKASRPVATWRPVDLTTWTKAAGRQVDKSKGQRREGSEGP